MWDLGITLVLIANLVNTFTVHAMCVFNMKFVDLSHIEWIWGTVSGVCGWVSVDFDNYYSADNALLNRVDVNF